jgi:hypothetical protein
MAAAFVVVRDGDGVQVSVPSDAKLRGINLAGPCTPRPRESYESTNTRLNSRKYLF